MTRRVLPAPLPRRISKVPHEGEPVVTAIWMAVSAMTLVLGVSFPCLGVLDSPLQPYVVPAVASLYALATAATCGYNRLRYGRIWFDRLPPARTRRARRVRASTANRRARPLAVMIG